MARPVREVVVESLIGQTIPPAPHDIPPIVQTASFVRCLPSRSCWLSRFDGGGATVTWPLTTRALADEITIGRFRRFQCTALWYLLTML